MDEEEPPTDAALLLPGTVTSFLDYFRGGAELETLLGRFGYGFESREQVLPRNQTPSWYEPLSAKLTTFRQLVRFNSEIARREFLTGPVLQEFIIRGNLKARLEYPLNISSQLQGSLDYLIWGKDHLLVVEAKNADIERGFAQLAAEMVALDQSPDAIGETLYGAVSLGALWQFCLLHRVEKKLVQELTTYRVPEDLRDVLQILSAILVGAGENNAQTAAN